MITLNVAAQVIKDLEGQMPESFRTLVARKLFEGYMKAQPEEVQLRAREASLPEIFAYNCKVSGLEPWVKHDIALSDTDLATFCNRWMQVEKFREAGGEWKPISSDMNSLRYTMVKELEALAQGPQAKYEGQ